MKKLTAQKIKTACGYFNFIVFADSKRREHVALVKGNVGSGANILCRIHTACILGENFQSVNCQCFEELQNAMRLCQKKNKGIIIWLNESTVADQIKYFKAMAERKLKRDFSVAANILKYLKVKGILLMTNNDKKVEELKKFGIKVQKYVNHEFKR